jgi:hypothetical protein
MQAMCCSSSACIYLLTLHMHTFWLWIRCLCVHFVKYNLCFVGVACMHALVGVKLAAAAPSIPQVLDCHMDNWQQTAAAVALYPGARY